MGLILIGDLLSQYLTGRYLIHNQNTIGNIPLAQVKPLNLLRGNIQVLLVPTYLPNELEYLYNFFDFKILVENH